MDEKQETPDEQKVEDKAEDKGEATPAEDVGEKKGEAKNLVEQAKIENDRKAKLLEEENKLQDRKEKLHAEEMVGGRAGLSAPEKPKRLTDTEYAEALQRGEVNPLKEDGFIK